MLATSATACRVTTGPVQPSVSSPFLRLPRELRDEVYDHYFRTDDGFTFDFVTNKLKLAGGLPIPLALTLTCRQIHDEVQGLALTLNAIEFATSFTEETQENAGFYHSALTITNDRKLALIEDLAPQLLSADMAEAATEQYPQFAPIISSWRAHRRVRGLGRLNTSWGEPPSIWRDFIDLVLSLIATDPQFVEQSHIGSRSYGGYDDDQALRLIGACTQPWIIPSTTELDNMVHITQVERKIPCYSPTTRYTYSAATSAIRFLRSITRTTRAAIRDIHVLEDRECIGSPECHARGFISFCQENPKLQVTHTVSLWKNAFPVAYDRRLEYMDGAPSDPDRDHLLAKGITKSIGTWLMEASALPSLGMPNNSYRLVLDGSPDIEYTFEVFRVVQRDVAWQLALDACYARALLPELSWLDRRCRPGYMYEGLPDVVRTLSTSGTLIRTNFSPGHSSNVQDLIEERQGWSLQEWDYGWAEHEPQSFPTKAPLPPWQTLRWQYAV